MKIDILDKTKKRKFTEKVEYLGIEKIHGLLIRTGTERVRTFSGSLSVDEIIRLYSEMRIEGIGLYLGKEQGDEVRLSLDALHMLKNQITKNVIEISELQEKEWFLGHDIHLSEEQKQEYKEFVGFVAVKAGIDFIGTGKIYSDKSAVSNFLPKERRVRS